MGELTINGLELVDKFDPNQIDDDTIKKKFFFGKTVYQIFRQSNRTPFDSTCVESEYTVHGWYRVWKN